MESAEVIPPRFSGETDAAPSRLLPTTTIMLPSQSFGSSNNQFQNMFATPAQGSYLPAGPFVQSQPQTIDVNSPELFKHNMQYIMQQIERIQSLIQSSIMGM